MKKINKKAVGGGLALGAINGLFGGGGGMIAVPILSDVLGYPRKQAHATAILIITPVCIVSAITYIVNGFTDLSIIIPAALGNVAGGLLGAQLLGKLPKMWVDIT
ncbi:MAG: sulfite exporter TauE/SafE family protein, partial [Clostridia bacterium]|nr:sulfite exporter TauE/SafE family protein [Clostridia bacterium]